ncbi:NADH-cytochrome b5 reductase-like [Scaptodrosophila lebanonensis]|uniref:NADH-cytochrome b5 reductase-like n=1 Tax=Drosophila lebanonensis TaxID=7225 RepID=A0A6J2TX20_DROLE|nr:NADH-cytochrome b5 reductase-like [Scaptodrosophila lebanonensis]
MVCDEEHLFEIDQSDCCGNGCTNCILDNKPKPSVRALLAGKRNVILNYCKFKLLYKQTHSDSDKNSQVLHLHFAYEAGADEDDGILDIPPGHHVMLRATVEAHAPPLLRPYSPYWVDFERKQFKILVKLQPDGPMSAYIAGLQPQALLEFRGPIGNYAHNASSPKCIFIIAQGVAIAPTLPLITQVLDNEDDMSRIHHMVCARDLSHLYFRERLLEFAKYWNYRGCAYLAHQKCASAVCKENGGCNEECSAFRASLRYKETVRTRRLGANELETYCQLAGSSSSNGERVLIIAGHANFQEQMRAEAMKALGVLETNVYLL